MCPLPPASVAGSQPGRLSVDTTLTCQSTLHACSFKGTSCTVDHTGVCSKVLTSCVTTRLGSYGSCPNATAPELAGGKGRHQWLRLPACGRAPLETSSHTAPFRNTRSSSCTHKQAQALGAALAATTWPWQTQHHSPVPGHCCSLASARAMLRRQAGTRPAAQHPLHASKQHKHQASC